MDANAVRLRAEDVVGVDVTINMGVADLGEVWRVQLSHCTLHAVPRAAAVPDATLHVDHALLVDLAGADTTMTDAIDAGRARVDGDVEAVHAVFDHLDTFESMFPIVEP